MYMYMYICVSAHYIHVRIYSMFIHECYACNGLVHTTCTGINMYNVHLFYCPGLHVKIGLGGSVVDYEYAPGPFRQTIADIDWVRLTAIEATYAHIRIHDLKAEDSLSFFMSTMPSTAALAVIFVNLDDNFRYMYMYMYMYNSIGGPVGNFTYIHVHVL